MPCFYQEFPASGGLAWSTMLAENYASKLMLEAKTVKPINSSCIMKSLDKLAGFTGKIISL